MVPVKSLASLEVAAIAHELEFLVQGKISRIYHLPENEILLELHLPGKGKQLLRILPGKLLYLTAAKEAVPEKPSGFCMQLRKYLDNATIKKIYQPASERVIVFELEKKEPYLLVVELFSKGNVILADGQYQIIGVLEPQTWKERTIKPGEKYFFPRSEVDWKKIGEEELKKIFRKSEKKSVVISLAVELGLGGFYAEEICQLNKLDKNKVPREMKEEEIESVIKTIKNFLKLIEKPAGYLYAGQAVPFPLPGEKPLQVTETYSEALDRLVPSKKMFPREKKIRALTRIVAEQEETIGRLEGKIKANTQKGELIYGQYRPLQRLLEIVKELRKSKSWAEIAAELKREKKIRQVDLKNKTVVIDL